MRRPPRAVLEVGVGRLQDCRTKLWWGTSTRCDLFEPLPRFYKPLKNITKKHKNVTVRRIALWTHDEGVTMYDVGGRSFIDGSPHRAGRPALSASSKEELAFSAPSALLSQYDPGDYDVALIDVESAEWGVLQHMVSRPVLISLELWQPKRPDWEHPELANIVDWMSRNGYREAARLKLDSHFVRN